MSAKERPLDPAAWEFWVKNDPTFPIKSTADGGLIIFLATDYAIEIRRGGRIGCKRPDHYQFKNVTLISDLPMEGNVSEQERP